MTRSRVLVVGSVNVDDAVRMARLPGPGETVIARELTTALGGKGANQAVAAARAGAEVRMAGAVGDDGGPLLDALATEGVDVAAIRSLDGPSGRALVLVGDDGENSIVVVPGANGRVPDDAVTEACAGLAAGDVLLLQREIPAASARLAAREARSGGAIVLWNAAPAPTSPEDALDDVDVLVVNEHELDALARPGGATVDARLLDLSEARGITVICTLGAEGAAVAAEGRVARMAAPRVEPVDTTAAGDTFVGFYAALQHAAADERLRLALAAASLAVTRPGAASSIPRLDEVRAFVGTRNDPSVTTPRSAP